jgi:hypothetical protein
MTASTSGSGSGFRALLSARPRLLALALALAGLLDLACHRVAFAFTTPAPRNFEVARRPRALSPSRVASVRVGSSELPPASPLARVGGSGGGALARESDGPAFARVLDGLNEAEKYNAVLQGLSGIVASRPRSSASSSRLSEVWDLLTEMQGNGVVCTERSCAAVVDASAVEADAQSVQESMLRLKRVGGAPCYSAAVPSLSPQLPRDEKRRAKMLAGTPPLPTDDRGKEVALAGAFLGVVSFDVVGDAMAPVLHYDGSIPGWVTAFTAVTVAADVLRGGANGSTQVLRGLNRLFGKDQERESRAEAAAFITAYLCGLPCFAFQPSAVEGARLVDACISSEEGSALKGLADGLRGGGGTGMVHRMLVWLLSPVAGEGLVHRQLIESDPRQARAFLRMVREGGIGGLDLDLRVEDDEDRIMMAYCESRKLLQKYDGAFSALRKRLETGAATVGECVSVLEESL